MTEIGKPRISGEVELSLGLSEQTPVYDALGIREIHQAALDFLVLNSDPTVEGRESPMAEIYLVGPVCGGKEAVAESIFWRNDNDSDDREKIKLIQGGLIQQYLSTPMCNAEGMRRGSIKNRIGYFKRGEIDASNLIMSEKSKERPKGPTFRVIETGIHGYPTLPFGVDPLKEAIERAKNDPSYKLLVVYILPTRQLQEFAMGIREIIADAQTGEEAKREIGQSNIQLDIPIDTAGTTRSWGNRRAMERVNKAGDWHAILYQDEIRKAYPEFPRLPKSRNTLEDRPLTWQRVHLIRAQYILDEFGVPHQDRMVVLNKKIPDKKITLWRGLGQKYSIMDMVAPVLSPAA